MSWESDNGIYNYYFIYICVADHVCSSMNNFYEVNYTKLQRKSIMTNVKSYTLKNHLLEFTIKDSMRGLLQYH